MDWSRPYALRAGHSRLNLMAGAAGDGLGLAYVMESTVQAELKSKRLLSVLDGFSAPFPSLFLYYASRAQLAPKLKAFIDFYKLPAHGRKRTAGSAQPSADDSPPTW